MTRRQSYSQQVFPTTPEFISHLKRLQDDGAKAMLGYVWVGFDSFKSEILDKNAAPSRENADLERDLTELLYPYICRAMPATLPYYLQHEKKERESAQPRRQPPEPDLSFVLNANPRVTFPMDAKVLERDTVAAMGDYVDTVRNRFIAGVYAPFSKEGAMLGFLLSGSMATVFRSLGRALRCRVSRRNYLTGRHHRTSTHNRPRAQYLAFRCHHLLMAIGDGARS